MLRQPLTRALALSPSRVAPLAARKFAAQADKVEVFIDDKPVYVPPGTTVLQVCILLHTYFAYSIYYIQYLCFFIKENLYI